ncbi:probable serine/threonine-protein kinase cdc7 [Scaptodrosophila lebanonensis]|uniref:Probable serine/threonine-protein kinase cdc7 n=1 Tax=Drosophila lebanonensis TaxID=7225 RepID=A0A6J2UJU3_DROLE|nr:probable serine/threonine-protein kinase cdc7 [Scaptodrosophila lebanonensis]
MQYLNYALQTSTRLLTAHSNTNTNTNTNTNNNTQTSNKPHTPTDEDIERACCSRGAQLLRQRKQELAKRRALEDQLNANAAFIEQQQLELQQEEQERERERREQLPLFHISYDDTEGAVGGYDPSTGGNEREQQQQQLAEAEDDDEEDEQPVQ